jgi:hypothetical protein
MDKRMNTSRNSEGKKYIRKLRKNKGSRCARKRNDEALRGKKGYIETKLK